MNQLEKARKEIAINTVDDIYPLILDSEGSTYWHRECTKKRPMNLLLSKGYGRWQHPEGMVHETDWDSDNYIEYKCNACNHKWTVEMPD